MKKNPYISIIVPVYNVESYLRTCLNSLINQSLKNIEIILVNDGSTDNSGRICEEYEKKHPNIILINKKNAGLGEARNSGIKLAKGKYIGFVDSDDFISEFMYESLFKLAKKYNADSVFCENIRFVNEKEISQIRNIKPNYKIYTENEILEPYLLERIGTKPNSIQDNSYGASVCSGIFKRKIIKDYDIKFVSERDLISEDMIFDIEYIPYCKKIVHTDKKMYYYRFNPNSLTTNYMPDRFEKNVILSKEMINRLEKKLDIISLNLSMSRYFLTFTRVSLIEEIRHIKLNGFNKTTKNIKKIVNNKELVDILNSYPLRDMPLKQSLFFYAVKYKMIGIIIILIRLNFFIKKFGV